MKSEKTVTVGQQGKLNGELLTVVSISGPTFKCDNGRSYMTSNAFWMTTGVEATIKPKVKRTKKIEAVPEDFYTRGMTAEERRESEEWMENARYRQAGSSLR